MSETVYYRAWGQANQAPTLSERIDADVCVIGAGFAGLNAALGIVERSQRSVVVLEAQQVGFGASGRNGGFIFGGYSLAEKALLRRVGVEDARALYQLSLDGIALIRRRVDDYQIDCDLNASGVLWANWFRDQRPLLQRQKRLAEQFDVEWDYLDSRHLRAKLRSHRYHGGLVEAGACHFNPLRYAQGLAAAIIDRGGRLFERSPVLSLETKNEWVEVTTTSGCVRAQQVVLAGGGYQGRLYPPVSKAIMPIATYVMVSEPLAERLSYLMPTTWAVYDTRFAFDYYRPLSDGRLLWGGRIAAYKASRRAIEAKLRGDLKRVFPSLAKVRMDYVWQGLMGYPRHQMPQLGCLDDRIWYAQGFGGHGVATSNIGGELIARAICEDDRTYRLFAPFGLHSVYGRFGRSAAQLRYWSLQARDWLKQRTE